MKKDNVIDMTERIQEPDMKARLKHLKVRFDLEQAKIAVSTSLLSVVVLVTLANTNLLGKTPAPETSARAIASVPTGTSESEDNFVHELAQKELSNGSVMGRKPSPIEGLAFGVLEGHYSVRLANGRLSELELSKDNAPDAAKQVGDLASFIENHRDIFPVDFDKSVRTVSQKMNGNQTEIFQLVDRVSRPLAKIEFSLDGENRLLSMHVDKLQAAQN